MSSYSRSIAAILGVALVFVAVPLLNIPAFYISFLYIIFYWITLATSWTILSGFAGYWSFGHAAFFGTGLYTSASLAAKLGVPFLLTLPLAACASAFLGAAIGFVVFRLHRLRGELFALVTISITFVAASIISNTSIDGGSGIHLINVRVPPVFGSQTATIYLLGLAMATLSLLIAFHVSRSRLGLGLFAIHDDEDAAEVKGVPTFRYKIIAIALSSGIAGGMGGVHSVFVGYVTVGETFEITMIMYPIVMSILGGAQSWLGPALGAIVITCALFYFATGPEASLARAAIALGLILAILLLPQGLMPSLVRWMRSFSRAFSRDQKEPAPVRDAYRPVEMRAASANEPESTSATVLECRDVWRAFGGVQALKGVTLDVRRGEILGLVGPNGSGKSTLINVITGQFPLDRGSISIDAQPISLLPAHRIAQLGVARSYQIPRPFNQLTVRSNVALAAQFCIKGCDSRMADEEALHWLAYTGLSRHADDLPGQLNLHERKFLELARALAARPRILFLDEVLSGLNHAEVDEALNLIRNIRDGGTTIVFVEHLMRAVVALTDRIVVLHEGAVIASGTPQETMRNPEVIDVYLGKSHAP